VSPRLVLWNVDLTLVDVGRVSRAAYAEAFGKVTGRPLVRLPQLAGRTDSEIFFEAVALNNAGQDPDALLGTFLDELAAAFAARRGLLATQGRLLPGAAGALAAVGRLPGVVQTVLTGSIRPNALAKLEAFGLAGFFDTEIGGYGSDAYPRGAMLLSTRGRAGEKYATEFTENSTCYIADSPRDMEAARMGGARAVGVATGRASPGELREAGADLVLPGLADAAGVAAAVDALTAAARSAAGPQGQ
jgi:phosphoglycolate phosphatase